MIGDRVKRSHVGSATTPGTSAAGILVFQLLAMGCGGQSPVSPTPDLVTESFSGVIDRVQKYHPFSMSQGGPVTLTVVEYVTPSPLDRLTVCWCARLRPPGSAADLCEPLQWTVPRDLDGQLIACIGEPGFSITLRLPPSPDYALIVTHYDVFHGPEYRYRLTLQHPR